MINREITYERDINKSYMKVASVPEESIDAQILFRKSFEGIIPVEKCFMNGIGQYWYNISGKQALDAYCRVNTIEQKFFETLILRICEQLEVLEWNLLDSNCLIVDPEFIFVNNKGEDISFVLYPQSKGDFFSELQQLMEYLLTKLNHSDKEAVHAAYQIYEITLTEGYNISDLKNAILERRIKEKKQVNQEYEYNKEDTGEWGRKAAEGDNIYGSENKNEDIKTSESSWQIQIEEKIAALCKKVREVLERKPADFMWIKKENKEDIPDVVYPEELKEEEKEIEIHPTVCLAVALGEPRGILIYEGIGNYPDFELGKMMCVIGKSHRARMQIERETISQFHAKIDYLDAYYIEDMNSTNGTYVNEEILNYKERKLLNPGDVIRFADVKYRFL